MKGHDLAVAVAFLNICLFSFGVVFTAFFCAIRRIDRRALRDRP